MKTTLSSVLISCLVVAVAGCSDKVSQDLSASEQVAQDRHLEELQALEVKRESTLAAMRNMPLDGLFQQMNQDSPSREHFNSPAYREMTRNRKSDAQALLAMIRQQRQVNYIPLMALRKIDLESYNELDPDLRIGTLAETLRTTKIYNRWGLPHLYWEAPAKSMVELGEAAVPALKKLLTDRTPADIMGFEESLEMKEYGYRRCDYALGMIMAIRKQDVRQIPKSPAARDEIIQTILNEG